MNITYAALSSAGPVRDNNEDYLAMWQPADHDERLRKGVVVIIADGVGGHGHGEVASRLAVETAVRVFQESSPDTGLRQLLAGMFTAANSAVYDAGMSDPQGGRMCTTLTISILRNNELAIGHVGDTRAYLLRGGKIDCRTTDHSYTGLQQKMGLLSKEEARSSDMRSILTRSIGREMVIAADIEVHRVMKNDFIVQCCDGIYGVLDDEELAEAALLYNGDDACKFLLRLAERKGAQDNTSVQVVRIDRVYPVAYHRTQPFHLQGVETRMGHEVEVGQTLDGRFKITDLISRSGMASFSRPLICKPARPSRLRSP